jgi:alpha-L-fucosidase
VIFSDAGPDVRWIGNEKGTAGDPNWSTVRPELVPYPGVSGPGVIEALQHGNRDGTVWRPGETDVSIRPGWFYHPAENEKVRSVDNLVELYFTSVGRNSKLLLNVPPTRDGLLHQTDVERLAGMRRRLDQLFEGGTKEWRTLSLGPVSGGFGAEVDLGRSAGISLVRLEEDIRAGQAVAQYELTGSNGGEWLPLSTGTTIGYAKLDRLPTVTVRKVRLKVLDSVRAPGTIRVGMFGEG